MMMTSAPPPPAAAKNFLIPRAAARVCLAAGAAEHALASVDAAAPFPALASTWVKNDLIDGFAAAADAALAPRLFGAAPAAAAAAELASSCAAGTKTEVINGCKAATEEDAARLAPGALALALEGRLREPCRSNTLAASCLVCACPLTLANSDLPEKHL